MPNYAYWTEEEIEKLKKYYIGWDLSANKIAQKLNRPYPSVKAKIKQLGLRHKKYPSEIAYAKKKKKEIVKTEENMYGKLRTYTFDTDMLIVQFMDEDDMSLRGIAYQLGRDVKDLEKHIEEAQKNGRLDKVREYLLRCGGVYATKVNYLRLQSEVVDK